MSKEEIKRILNEQVGRCYVIINESYSLSLTAIQNIIITIKNKLVDLSKYADNLEKTKIIKKICKECESEIEEDNEVI